MTEIKGRTFEGTTVDVDNCRFIECLFKDVILVFSGGPFGFVNCRMTGLTSHEFHKHALSTVEYLKHFNIDLGGLTRVHEESRQ
jgi:hypothetical protein